MKMRIVCLMLFFLNCCFSANAQTGKLKGTVSNESGHPVVGASVQLIAKTNIASKWETSTSAYGEFSFAEVEYGNYILSIHHLGFAAIDTIKITISKDELTLPAYTLKTQARQLKEVTVTDKKQLFEMRGGTMTYNVEKSAAAAGNSAFDLLRKTPGVSVDPDENLLLKGSVNVNILVDGKRTYLSGQQLGNMLKGMTAEQISKIEVTSTPGSQYDAAGNAGIINIVTKKNTPLGYAVSLTSGFSVNRYFLPNSTITASVKTTKVNLFGSFGYTPYHNYSNRYSQNIITANNQTSIYDRIYGNSAQSFYYTYKAGADISLDKKNSMGLSYTGNFDNWSKHVDGTTDVLTQPGNNLSRIINNTTGEDPYFSHAVNLNYKYLIDSLKKNITADADYILYRNFSKSDLLSTTIPNPPGQALTGNRIQQPALITITSLKTDLDLPYKVFEIKAGAKFSEVKSRNNFVLDSLSNSNYVPVPSLNSNFAYTERITAAYGSTSAKWKRTEINAGLRLEHTYALGEGIAGGNIERNYVSLFPFFSVSNKIGTDNSLDLSVTRRINRPSYSSLNPVRYYSDKSFYFTGNPVLQPEIAWVTQLNYVAASKYVFSLTYNCLTNFIGQYASVDANGIIVTTSTNYKRNDRVDMQVVIPFSPVKNWDITVNTDLSYTTYPIPQLSGALQAKRINFSGTLNQVVKLPNNFTTELNGTYLSGELNGIYLTKYYYQVDWGVKKSFPDKKLDIKLSVNDILHTNRFAGRSLSDAINYTYNYVPYSRKLNFIITYRIGGKLSQAKIHRAEEQNRL